MNTEYNHISSSLGQGTDRERIQSYRLLGVYFTVTRAEAGKNYFRCITGLNK